MLCVWVWLCVLVCDSLSDVVFAVRGQGRHALTERPMNCSGVNAGRYRVSATLEFGMPVRLLSSSALQTTLIP